MSDVYENALRKFRENQIDSFDFLRVANDLLTNPVSQVLGRDLIIRALDQRDRFQSDEVLLRALVRKSGLYPYLNSEFSKRSLEEDYAIALYRAEHASDFIYHSMQLKVLNLLQSGRNVVLSAPTSMGKSAIIDALIGGGKYRRIVIVVPSIALIDETRRRLARKFERSYDIISHNSQPVRENRCAVFVLTQERVNERSDLSQIDLFVIDEFYKLALKNGESDERAIALNICLSKLLLVSRQFYMIGPSVEEVRGLNRFGKSFVFVPANFNTVAVDVKEYNLNANDRAAKIEVLINILRQSKSQYIPQTIVYCRSPKSAAEIVEALINAGLGVIEESDYSRWIEAHYGKSWSYSRALKNGFGIHHGSLPRAIQQYTIDLFNAKRLNILVCTSTIIEGVNTNAEIVVVFDNRNGLGSIDRFTHNNIKGRAGRMSVHFVGTVHCLEAIPAETYESKVVDVALGMQSEASPPNLLTAISEEHLQEPAKKTLNDYLDNCSVPIWLLKKFPAYRADRIRELYLHVARMSAYELRQVCVRKPNAAQIELICQSMRTIELAALQKCNLQSGDSDLKLKFSRYLFAESHQAYLNSIIAWIESNYGSAHERAQAMDRDLKILRNIFTFAVPRVVALLQEIVNLVCFERKYNFSCDYAYIRAIFENQHLPGCLSVLEEMGIPVQTLAKFARNELVNKPVNVVMRYLRIYVGRASESSKVEKEFFSKALWDRDVSTYTR